MLQFSYIYRYEDDEDENEDMMMTTKMILVVVMTVVVAVAVAVMVMVMVMMIILYVKFTTWSLYDSCDHHYSILIRLRKFQTTSLISLSQIAWILNLILHWRNSLSKLHSVAFDQKKVLATLVQSVPCEFGVQPKWICLKIWYPNSSWLSSPV